VFGNHQLPPLILLNLLGVAGICVWHLQGRSRPTGRLIVQFLFFAGMSLILFVAETSPYGRDDIDAPNAVVLLSRLAGVLWWTHLAWTVIGFIHIYVRLNHKPREAHLIQDMAIGVIYLGASLSAIRFVFGMPLGTLVTTSGVVAIVIGLALQNTLGDVFSGIALTLGKAYMLGDWIRLTDGTEGRVIETNWRSTNLLSGANNIVVLPNSILARQGVTNLSRPDETHLIVLNIRIATEQSPHFIERELKSVLEASTRIVRDPAPIASLKAIDAVAVEAELQFRVDSLAIGTAARNEIIHLLYCRSRKHGLSLAMPSGFSPRRGHLSRYRRPTFL
jgi:small-conductance mechanosensitive channel